MRGTLILSLLVFLVSSSSPAQTPAGTGSVNGTVRDPYGEGLPGVEVVLTNEDMNIHLTVETTIDGLFDMPGLPPAEGYRLKMTRKGYASWESGPLQVPVGQPLGFDMVLEEATTSRDEGGASVSSGPGVLVPGPSVVVSRQQIDELPVPGRRLESLVLLAPSTAWDSRTQDVTFRGQPLSSRTFLDGVVATGSRRAAPTVSQDAGEGVEILTGGFAAELGGTMGGVINIATRSGTNAYHGGVYDYFRNRRLTGIQRFALGHNLAGTGHQAGANLGGPIRKDKLFFFFNFEARDTDSQVLNRITSPFVADSTGTSVAVSNCTAAAAQCAAAVRFIEGQMNVLAPRSVTSAAGIAKIDYRRGQWDSFRFEAGDTRQRWPEGEMTEAVAANGGSLGQAAVRRDTRFAKAGWTAVVGPTAVNELGYGYSRDRVSAIAPQTGLSTGSLFISVADATVGSAQHYRDSVRKQRRDELGDQLSVVAGAHRLKVGAAISENPNWIDELYNGAGAYSYPSLTAFATDLGGGGKNYTLFSQTLGTSGRKFRVLDFSAYAQDTWQPLPRLTMSGGLRWENARLPRPQASDSYYYQTRSLPSPNLDFAPRIGVAYKLDDRTVARFGFGFFYAPFSSDLIDALVLGHAKFQTNIAVNRTYTAAPAFPNIIGSVSGIPAGTKNVSYAASKFWSPFTPQTNLAVERRLGAGFSLAVRYIASPGKRLLTMKDMNLNATTTTKEYTVADEAGQTIGSFSTPVWTARGSTNYSHVYEVRNDGSSSYNALVLQLRKDISRGVGLEAYYTWSHAISDTGGPWALPSVPLSTYSGNPAADKGDTSTDQRHRAVAVWSWQPHVTGSVSWYARYLLNGWQHSAIATLASGLPATALVQVNGQQFSGTTMLYTSSLNGSGGWSRIPFEPVNGLRMGAGYTVNARLSRTLPFTERVQGNLVLEAFNLFDAQFATGVNEVCYMASGGVIRRISGAGTANAASSPRSARLAFRLRF
jgi:hypothetical protein